MVRHHHVRVVADFEQPVVSQMSTALQLGNFREQRDWIDDQSVTDDANFSGMKRAGRNQPQHEFFSVDDQRVRGVVAALKADDHVGVGGEHIDNLALALVSPLRADHGNCFHSFSPDRRPPSADLSAHVQTEARGARKFLRA